MFPLLVTGQEIYRNGLAMPPRMTLGNILQIMGRPDWAIRTLIHGQPAFANMKPYMPKGLDMKQLGVYMNKTFSGRLNEEKIAPIRDMWKGKLVLKGIVNEEDTRNGNTIRIRWYHCFKSRRKTN